MEITTIACPPGFTDPNVVENAPIWIDANGVEYAVASGPLEGYILEEDGDTLEEGAEIIPYVTSDPIEAQPNRVNVVVGMDGLTALAIMGLTVKTYEGENNG
jgi:hypothetical protein